MAANEPDPGRLLSIQSHVVTGYAGNRSAVFPLQLLGWEVDVINTTQLSNHTGYRRFGGMRLDADHLESVFSAMDTNGLLRYGRLLSGYTPSPSALSQVAAIVKRLRSLNPDLVYLLDPVMGDIGRGYYVDKGCLPIYRELLASATIICPNQFEAQELAGGEVTSLQSLKQVLTKIHDRGAENIIITSLDLPPDDLTAMGAKATGGMVLVGSSRQGASNDLKPWYIQFRQLTDYFVGVGDLFSALMLGNYETETSLAPAKAAHIETSGRSRRESATASGRLVDSPLARAAELAIAGVQAVLQTTQAHIDGQSLPSDFENLEEGEKLVANARLRELRLVQSRQKLDQPSVEFRAHWLP